MDSIHLADGMHARETASCCDPEGENTPGCKATCNAKDCFFKCSRISPPPEKDCQTPPGCRMLATQTCSSSRILALQTNGVETSCTREMRSRLVTQVEGCMKFGSHSVKMMYHMIWIDMVASCLESDGNPMEIS